MKKTFFWMAMLMLGLSCAVWTGCSDDNKDDNGGKPETPVVKDTLWVVSALKANSLSDEGFYKQATFTRNVEGAITEIKIGNYSPRGENGSPVIYPVTREAGKVTIVFDDVNAGESMKLVYTLNAKGYATKVQRLYAVDGVQESEYRFKYNAKDQLTEIDMVDDIDEDGEDDEVPVFKATYAADGNWTTCLLVPDLGEGEVMGTCTASKLVNNYSFDLNLLTLTNGESYFQKNMVQCAVYLGLLPSTPNVLASAAVDGETLEITAGIKDKRIETLKMTMFADIVLTTVLKETEKN